MSVFDLKRSLAEAERRLPRSRSGAARRPRSDAGRSRLPKPVAEALSEILHGQERPAIGIVEEELARACERVGHPTPARATIYRFMTQCPPRQYLIRDLPEPVRRCLYNLDRDASVPGHQLVFYAFNYGEAPAMSFASGMPWLALYQADRMRGWRPRSHGLLRAVLRRRGI